jgi:hypothetical protein
MRNNVTVTLTVCSVLALAGCADHVLFVTKTSLGIDFDSQPASASIAYDRIDGYIAPRYDNGEIPAVVASVKSDGGIFNPQIRQIYATGDAAEIVVEARANPAKTENKEGPKLQGNKKLMFFGSTTTTGLKVGFSTGLPDSLIFGFRRKEFSFIPLGTVGTGAEAYDVYPSVLASIDTSARAGTPSETGLRNIQFFATGQAARSLATNDIIRQDFKTQALRSLATATGYSQSAAAQALRDYVGAALPTKEEKRYRYEEVEAAVKIEDPNFHFISATDFTADTTPAAEELKEKVAQRLRLSY